MSRGARIVNGIDLAAHGGLIGRVVARYRGSIGGILEWEDLFQEGWLGLYKAAQRFDPAKGFKFSTYANWWIRHQIQRAIMDKRRTIRVPIHAQNAARDRGERIPYDALSLNVPLDPTNPEAEWIDMLRGEGDPESDADSADMAEHVRGAVDALPEMPRRAVRGRFWGDYTLREIADDVGLSRERIRQREAEGMARLERPLGKLRSDV